jgi:hypothetical protein
MPGGPCAGHFQLPLHKKSDDRHMLKNARRKILFHRLIPSLAA